MRISQLICPLLILGVTSLVVADRSSNKGLCIQPEVENGMVNIISESGSILVANVTCNSEYQLVGKKVIKCQKGVWSSKAPICTRMGGCEVRDLPQVENSRRILVKPFRGNVVKYKCRTHYRLFGQNMFHCADGGKWGGGEAPVCTRPGCDESQVHQIPYGTTKKMMKGALYQFNCDEGAVLSGSPTIFCDGKSWNDTAPTCLSPPGEPSLKLRVDNEPYGQMEELAVLRVGQTVSLRCTSKGGNPVPSLTFTKNGASFGPGPKAYQNTHTFVATTEDNGAVFGCIAQNQADGRADSKTVRLNVLYTPDAPTMTLRVDNQPFDGALADLQAGQMVEIRCESELGNPVASLHLTKNGISFGPIPRSSYIAHTFMVTALDSGSVLGCTAIENQNNWSADSQTVELNVLWTPSQPSFKVLVDNEPVVRKDGVAVLKSGHTVELSCTSESGNPVTSLTFTKNGDNFGPEPVSHKISHAFQVTPEDNGALLGCTSQNQDNWQSESEALRLHVLFPPERLTVEGPDELTADYNARFTCKASASNLPSKLTFKLTSHHSDLLDDLVNNGLVEIEEPKEKWIDNESHNNGQGAPGWASSRSLILKTELLKRAGQLGEHITFECQIPDPYHERRILISATKFVTLHNPIPTVELKLKVAGPSEVRYNEPAQFRCESNREDIEFTMALDQQNIKTAFTSAEYLLSAGQLEYGTNQFVLECFALDENNDKETISHTVNVLYPPGRPEITPGKALMTSGTEQKLTCEGKAGNPPAKLEWYRDSTMIESQYTLEGDMVKAEVTFTAGPEDNGSELRCEATNSAVSKPVSETITIELLPETTSTTTESVTKVEKEVVPVQIVKNSIEETNTDSTEKGSNTPKDDYAYYDDDQYDYYSMNNKEKSDPYAHPEDISTNILTGIISVDGKPKRPETVQKETNIKTINDKKQEIDESSHPNSVYPKTDYRLSAHANSPATLSVSFSCLILAFLLHN